MSKVKKTISNVIITQRKIDCFIKYFKIGNIVGWTKVFRFALDTKTSLLRAPWLLLYSKISGYKSMDYITEFDFYVNIEPKLNKISYSQAIEDKSSLNAVLGFENVVGNIVEYINNCYYMNEKAIPFELAHEKLIIDYSGSSLVIKPSNQSGGGRGVVVGNVDTIAPIMSKYAKSGIDFVVQEKLVQHTKLSGLFPDSVNTIRIMTVRKDDRISVLSSVLRVGVKKGVDNEGLSIGIKDGVLNDFAVAIKDDFKVHYKHPITSSEFSGLHIPSYETIEKVVKDKHKLLTHFNLVSWDVAIDDDGIPQIIEFNTEYQELNFHQLNNGAVFSSLLPLLG